MVSQASDHQKAMRQRGPTFSPSVFSSTSSFLLSSAAGAGAGALSDLGAFELSSWAFSKASLKA